VSEWFDANVRFRSKRVWLIRGTENREDEKRKKYREATRTMVNKDTEDNRSVAFPMEREMKRIRRVRRGKLKRLRTKKGS
jgi:hypothetical protein